MILFSIFNNKKIIKKWARGPRGCDVARKATWQRHVDPRSAPTWREYILYSIILININGFLSSPYRGGSYPYKRSGIIYPTVSINKVRVGLIFLAYLPCRRRGATIGVGSTASVDLTRRSREPGSLIAIKNTCGLNSYNGSDFLWRRG